MSNSTSSPAGYIRYGEDKKKEKAAIRQEINCSDLSAGRLAKAVQFAAQHSKSRNGFFS